MKVRSHRRDPPAAEDDDHEFCLADYRPYGGPVALWAYFKSAPKTTKQHMQQMKQELEAELQRESTDMSACENRSRSSQIPGEVISLRAPDTRSCTLG